MFKCGKNAKKCGTTLLLNGKKCGKVRPKKTKSAGEVWQKMAESAVKCGQECYYNFEIFDMFPSYLSISRVL